MSVCLCVNISAWNNTDIKEILYTIEKCLKSAVLQTICDV